MLWWTGPDDGFFQAHKDDTMRLKLHGLEPLSHKHTCESVLVRRL